MRLTRIHRFLTVAPLAWAAAVAVAALVAKGWAAGTVAYSASAVVYAIGSLICHQLPERSFHLGGTQLAVCARCTGLYAGAAAMALAAVVQASTRLEAYAFSRARVLLAIAATPTIITLVYEWSTGIMPGHAIRAAAGFVLGAIVMAVMLGATASASAVEIH